MQNIIFFTSTPLNKRDRQLYGLDFLNQKGYKVYILNFWEVLSPGIKHKTDEYYEFQISLKNWKETYKCLKQFKKDNSIFISDVSYSKSTINLYLILTILNIKYHFVDNWYGLAMKNKKITIDNILNYTLKKALKLIVFKLTIITSIITYRLLLKKPHFVFWPNKLSHHCKMISGKFSISIPYCTFDYNQYIELTNNKVSSLLQNDYFLLLDEYLTDHPDFTREHESPPVTHSHYESINKFCNILKKNLNLEFVVACHPRRIVGTENEFNTDKSFYYKTAELVQNAKFILVHNSLAIQLPVLWKKPIIFMTTNELINTRYNQDIEIKASELGKNIINIDNFVYDTNFNNELNIDDTIMNKYNDFILKHVVYNESNTLKTYEIIYNTINSAAYEYSMDHKYNFPSA